MCRQRNNTIGELFVRSRMWVSIIVFFVAFAKRVHRLKVTKERQENLFESV